MDERRFQEPYEPSRRRPRPRDTSPPPPTRPADAQGPEDRRIVGRVSGLVSDLVILGEPYVKLFLDHESYTHFPLSFFESRKWVEIHVDRWVIFDRTVKRFKVLPL